MASSAPRSILRRLALRHTHTPRPNTGIRAIATTSALRVREPPPPPPKGSEAGMGVGELEGAKFRVEPLRRVGEDDKTMRARLTYQSRKRGTLESDLLLSTFADAYLPTMTREQMAQYDLFLDENDWDIYYWATQEPPPSSSVDATTAATPSAAATTADVRDSSDADYGSGAEAALAESSAEEAEAASGSATSAAATTTSTGGTERTGDSGADKEAPATSSSSSASADADVTAAAGAAAASAAEPYGEQGDGGSIEWAQTVGTFKPAYRPVPARWRDSEVLRLLREHVKKQAAQRGGMAFMPELRHGS
ncbi:hypothetical protein DL770_006057 [Monosporascus sp. CRB-9-2]|nr:hypothetical protein DL770_006057 [Monosporascus sp. CRB-9-2]